VAESIQRALAGRIRGVVLDVDGVLTDGGIWLGETADGQAVELKRFEITDQLGIRMLEWAGIRVAFVSGRRSAANRLRAEELGVEWAEGPGGHKLEAVSGFLDRNGLTWDELACVCDDLADMSILTRAALPVAVANAVAEVKAVAVWRTSRTGGAGAVREFAEALLRARGEWDDLVQDYCRKRDDVAVSETGS
jgi:3-deoxy-D-manno-octulosonate 8-phosphate phosphatase (KDO 8-P phosphatase)